jgi:thiol:disulfide interchange protein DsbD
MKHKIAILLLLVLLTLTGLAQSRLTPYKWSYQAKKLAGNTYELHFVVDINSPWHTYSQFTPDGGPVPTHFEFTKNPLYTLDGKVKENGKLINKHEAVFGVDVKYFNGTVDFVQVVKVKGNAKTNFTGAVEFMVCNDQQCLPPTTEKFSIPLN